MYFLYSSLFYKIPDNFNSFVWVRRVVSSFYTNLNPALITNHFLNSSITSLSLSNILPWMASLSDPNEVEMKRNKI